MRETLARANLGRRSRVGESKEKVAYSSTPPGANERICRYANFLASVQTRSTTHAAALFVFVMRGALGSRPAPGTPSAKRSVGTRRAASMQDTLSEGIARAAQLAPSAVTASAVGGSATRTSRSVVGCRLSVSLSPTTSGSSTLCDRACSSTKEFL